MRYISYPSNFWISYHILYPPQKKDLIQTWSISGFAIQYQNQYLASPISISKSKSIFGRVPFQFQNQNQYLAESQFNIKIKINIWQVPFQYQNQNQNLADFHFNFKININIWLCPNSIWKSISIFGKFHFNIKINIWLSPISISIFHFPFFKWNINTNTTIALVASCVKDWVAFTTNMAPHYVEIHLAHNFIVVDWESCHCMWPWAHAPIFKCAN